MNAVDGMDAEGQAGHLGWLMRISDDMWGAAQLLGLFFLGATILCVPPRLGASVEVSYAATQPDQPVARDVSGHAPAPRTTPAAGSAPTFGAAAFRPVDGLQARNSRTSP